MKVFRSAEESDGSPVGGSRWSRSNERKPVQSIMMSCGASMAIACSTVTAPVIRSTGLFPPSEISALKPFSNVVEAAKALVQLLNQGKKLWVDRVPEFETVFKLAGLEDGG